MPIFVIPSSQIGLDNRSYGDMQTRIADEILRSDLTSQIQNAIQTAIKQYERIPFYFNQIRQEAAFFTAQGQEFYTSANSALIAQMVTLNRVTVTVSGNRYSLNPRTPEYLEDTSVNPIVLGQPVDYAYFAEQLRFYPIPDNAYSVALSGIYRLFTLANSSDTNPWTSDAELLIRSRAKYELALHVLRDADMATLMKASELEALSDLRGETIRRTPRRIRPTYF
ncbi:hypothetical protein [Burkholderia sp. GbtcB21]|uniref:phage adaptor protein n=1 Tax=Burkholderia sp. GbtcB21 TaxID=2824766 RepID=UPI001C2F5337|nr:hypothetical protein [Burkholderia sp. GbtcB21]